VECAYEDGAEDEQVLIIEVKGLKILLCQEYVLIDYFVMEKKRLKNINAVNHRAVRRRKHTIYSFKTRWQYEEP